MATYACTDIHGQYGLWLAIKNYCKEDDTIIFLGDAIDRGPEGIRIMQELLEDKRVLYIMGNHEDTFLEYIKIGIPKVLHDRQERELLEWNGGIDTLKQFLHLTDDEQEKLIFNLKTKLIKKVLYINKENKKIFLCHAGCNPSHISKEYPIKDYLWDRKHIATHASDWNLAYNDYIVVHGHTPVQLLKNQNKADMTKDSIETYCGGHKIDLDLGSFFTNKIALFDLDTFETIYFTKKENINE